jgi:hypothetical protein
MDGRLGEFLPTTLFIFDPALVAVSDGRVVVD